MGEMPMRLFLAVPLGERAQSDLEASSRILRQHYPFQKWMHPADYHLTLKFLGDADTKQTERVKSALFVIAQRHLPFRLRLQGFGAFGPPAAPSVLWSGVSGDMSLLEALQQDAEREMRKLGFPAENRAYRPHITLARRYKGPAPFRRELLPQPGPDAEWSADRIVLYRSHLQRTPMYEALAAFPLHASPSPS